MTDPSSARRAHTGFPALLLSLLATAALALAITPAAAAAPVKGKATLTLGSGKAGKALKKQRVKLVRVAPAKVKRLKGKRFRVNLPARSVNGKAGRAALKGGLKFKRGKRALPARNLVVAVKGRTVRVTAKLGGSKVKLFAGKGKTSKVNGDVVRVKVSGAKLKLTGKASKMIKRKLKLKRKVPAAAYGNLKLNASGKHTDGPVVTDPDPYFVQCSIAAESEAGGNLPAAAPMPAMAGAKPLAADSPDIAWGFKASFRGYMGGTGSLHAVGGAGRDGAGPIAGFTFPVKDGLYKTNDPAETGDDQAVINGKGAAVFCNPGHGFRVVIANPTIVIDGTDARIVADVDTNYYGLWTPAQRVDLAELDLKGISPFYNRSGSEITWQDIPANLTATGAQSFCEPASEDRPGQCLYHEGDELDPLSVTVKTGGDQIEPFPLTAYCNWTPSDNTNTRGIAPNWPERILPPLHSGHITGKSTSDASLDWGVKQGFRGRPGSVITPAAGDGATMSNPPGATGVGNAGDMGGAGKYFTWTGTDGTWDADSGRLVQRFRGKVGLCQKDHGYGSVIADPTVVIDGDNSRLSADVATRVGDDGDWVRGRVDLVTFKASEAVTDPSPVGGATSWTIPDESESGKEGVVVGEQGGKLLGPLGYAAGTRFQGMTIRATVPTE